MIENLIFALASFPMKQMSMSFIWHIGNSPQNITNAKFSRC